MAIDVQVERYHAAYIIAAEARGAIYDIETGETFVQDDDIMETAIIWKRERWRRNLPVQMIGLIEMIEKSMGCSRGAAAMAAQEIWFDPEFREADVQVGPGSVVVVPAGVVEEGNV